jgi:hypothetical protein
VVRHASGQPDEEEEAVAAPVLRLVPGAHVDEHAEERLRDLLVRRGILTADLALLDADIARLMGGAPSAARSTSALPEPVRPSITSFVRVEDVQAALQVGRTTAYDLLRMAAGNAHVKGTILRVPQHVWEQFIKHHQGVAEPCPIPKITPSPRGSAVEAARPTSTPPCTPMVVARCRRRSETEPPAGLKLGHPVRV